eukprot:1273613-Rhodomonas_salina.3
MAARSAPSTAGRGLGAGKRAVSAPTHIAERFDARRDRIASATRVVPEPSLTKYSGPAPCLNTTWEHRSQMSVQDTAPHFGQGPCQDRTWRSGCVDRERIRGVVPQFGIPCLASQCTSLRSACT